MRWLTRAVPGVLAFLVATLALMVLYPFLVPVAWAAIIAYVTWPAYERLCRAVGGANWKSALLMVIALSIVVVSPLWWLSLVLGGEMASAYRAIAEYFTSGAHTLPEPIARLPWIGGRLQEWLDQYAGNPNALRGQINTWVESSLDEFMKVLGGAGRNLFKLGMAALTLFFLYRDGRALFEQIRRVLRQYVGPSLAQYLDAIGATTKAVVYGLIATAFAQGLVAGLGYWIAGAPAPASLAALTAFLALVPFGAPLVWVPVSITLFVDGHPIEGTGLLLWGLIAVSWIDNVVRPLVISSATRIPFLLVLFGVIGGVTAFGLIGLFLGPVILAVLLAIWREWVQSLERIVQDS